ncbi:MAG: c-di-GMP-binding flagellar brake protein YcgR [bacterium]|jgi:c-di-GMP-binding flagellar brake protein YcgR
MVKLTFISFIQKLLVQEISLDLKKLFKIPENVKLIDPLLILLLGIFLMTIALIIIGANFIGKRRNEREDNALNDAQLKRKYENLEISKFHQEIIANLAKVINMHPIHIFNDHEAFEHAVSKLQDMNNRGSWVKDVPDVREILGYTFLNPRTRFIKTHILQVGQKVRVFIPHPTKDISYVSTILNNEVDYYWISPPKVKGKTAKMSKIKELDFHVYRQNDAEYRFRSKLLEQVTEPTDALVMRHTGLIERLHKRQFDRYQISFPANFNFSSRALIEEGKKHFTNFQAKVEVKDLSTGGLRCTVPTLAENVALGDSVTFQLPQAKLKKQIQSRIVRINRKENEVDVHIRFLNLSELNRLFIQRFLENESAKKY